MFDKIAVLLPLWYTVYVGIRLDPYHHKPVGPTYLAGVLFSGAWRTAVSFMVIPERNDLVKTARFAMSDIKRCSECCAGTFLVIGSNAGVILLMFGFVLGVGRF